MEVEDILQASGCPNLQAVVEEEAVEAALQGVEAMPEDHQVAECKGTVQRDGSGRNYAHLIGLH